MKQFGLFPPRARYMEIDVGTDGDVPTTNPSAFGVQLIVENPYDALERIRPGADVCE